MAKLEAYDKTLDYSYAPGIFPATECLKNAKKRCMRLLVSSNGLQSEGVQALEKAAQEADIRVEVADRALERISKKENCFAAMVYKKAEGRFDEDSPHIVLHHPSDSGNLGTILRTADAFGLDAVILCEGCTDASAPKVVRATMGAAFRQPVYRMPLAEAIAALHARHMPVYAAALEPDSVSVTGMTLCGCAVIVGNEGRGVTRQALDLCDKKIIIPMRGRAESLNAGVAASLLIWEMAKGAQA